MERKQKLVMDEHTSLTGAQIYDALMADIEPELLTANIPLLDETYATETVAERAKRLKRYERAYAAYDKAYASWREELDTLMHEYKRESLRSAEGKEREREQDLLRKLETDINTPSPSHTLS